MITNNINYDSDNVKFISLKETPHKVWTKKIGEGDTKMLALAGGPGLSHDYLQPLAENLPKDKVTFYFYDQLGTGESERQLADESLWQLDRYVEEVEQVRIALGLDKFVLYGHSWGAMLAIEYALKYPEHLEGLILSNMTASVASYSESYSKLREMLSAEDQAILEKCEKEEDFDSPEYQAIIDKINEEHICRVPLPDYAIKSLVEMNKYLYQTMMGKNEFHPEGNLKDWDRWNDLEKIHIPTLLSTGRYDIMSVDDIKKMQALMPNAIISICENGGHLSMIDSAKDYFKAINNFLQALKNNYFANTQLVNNHAVLFNHAAQPTKQNDQDRLRLAP